MTLNALLIANRGEIAVRIARTARSMGLRAIAIYSDADRNAFHTWSADYGVGIGGETPADSYLRIERVIEASKKAGAQAIHPGYGFLSERADFALACAEAGLIFVGPAPETIALMGDKAEARRFAAKAGLPVLAGYDGPDQADATLQEEARRIGFPVMIKAAAGGGGRGMRLAKGPEDLPALIEAARAEALAAFGDARLILEEAVLSARHIEVQVFGDQLGNVVHLGERDCSVQRRHQKLLEEAPAPGLSPALRKEICDAAVTLARHANYVGAGTVEFLLSPKGRFTFMEMNTRLQVEHPVTEAVTGLDLVEWQIRVARGEKLPLAQEEIRFDGHAMEARLTAEDSREFLPQVGTLLDVVWPEGVRIDPGIEAGSQVTRFYDSLLAKIIAHGTERDVARRRLVHALEATSILGLKTNAAFLKRALQDDIFARGEATIGFIAERFPSADDRGAEASQEEKAVIAALAASGAGADRVELAGPGWTNALPLSRPLRFEVDGKRCNAHAAITRMPHMDWASPGHRVLVNLEGRSQAVDFHEPAAVRRLCRAFIGGREVTFRFAPCAREASWWFDAGYGERHVVDLTLAPPDVQSGRGSHLSGQVVSPIQAKVAKIFVTEGERVAAGTVIAAIEAMKLEHRIVTAMAGEVAALHVAPGASVRAGQAIATIKPIDSDPLK